MHSDFEKASWEYDMETYLQTYLVPLAPRPQFVAGLKKRLFDSMDPSEITVESDSTELLHKVLLGGAGVVSSVFLLVASIRAVITIIGAIGAIRQLRQKRISEATGV
jgi:hypothetical protein